MNNINKIQQIQDLYVKNIKNDKNFPIKDLPKRFVNKEIVEIAYENGVLELIDKDVLTKVINDDVELWDKIIEYDPYYIKSVPKEYITDDLLMKAYNYDNNLINFLLKTNYNIVTEEMLKNYKSKPLDEENADNIRKIIKDDSVYKILIRNSPKNIKIMPRDRKELFTHDICHIVLKYESRLIEYIPKECIPDSVYRDLPRAYVSQLVKYKEFYDDESTYLKLLDDFLNINYIPSEYITDDLCKSFSPFCNYIISNKDKIDTESVCIDIVNSHHFDNNIRRAHIIVSNYFKDILLLGKKYTGKAIDILIDRYPYLIKYARYDDINSFNNDLYIKIIKSDDFLISSIPENKITREMYIAAFISRHNWFVRFPNHRKDLIDDDFCIEYLKSHTMSLSDIAEEYRTEKVCLYAYEKSKSNIRHFPKNMIHLFKEDMCIDCLTDYTIQIKYIPDECITAKIVEKAFEVKPHYILNDKCSKFITKEMCIKLANEYNDLCFINYIDDELLLELYDVIIDKLTQK